MRTDVAKADEVAALRDRALSRFGDVALLMNNAGVGRGGSAIENPDGWRRVLETNLFGVLNGVQAFAQGMIDAGKPAAIVNTGSKQGITCPPGDTAYNVSKAGIKVLTEGLQHTLRNTAGCQVSAHLLVPGSTFTGMTARRGAEKPAGAWTAGAGGRLHAGADGGRRLLHPLPRQRRHPGDGQRPHDLGDAGPHPEPPAALALAPRLRARLRRVPGPARPGVADGNALVHHPAEGGVDVVTFGCRLNAYESDRIAAQAAADGIADAVVFNTCAVTAEAVRQARQQIRKARRERPHARLVVTGCAAQIDPAAFAAMPEVDLVLGNAEKAAPGALLRSGLQVGDIFAAQLRRRT